MDFPEEKAVEPEAEIEQELVPVLKSNEPVQTEWVRPELPEEKIEELPVENQAEETPEAEVEEKPEVKKEEKPSRKENTPQEERHYTLSLFDQEDTVARKAMLFAGPLPTMYGAWVHIVTGLTQHGGLAENVLDHRLNSRTVYMNPVMRFIYWNMNYHIEHHMFPMVPYHALPELHRDLQRYLPRPSSGIFDAYRDIIPALWRQRKEPDWHITPKLPEGVAPVTAATE